MGARTTSSPRRTVTGSRPTSRMPKSTRPTSATWATTPRSRRSSRGSPDAPDLAPGRRLRAVLVRVTSLVLGLCPLEDVECLGNGAAVLIGGPLDVLVRDVRLAHLEVGIHAATGQTHVRRLLSAQHRTRPGRDGRQ